METHNHAWGNLERQMFEDVRVKIVVQFETAFCKSTWKKNKLVFLNYMKLDCSALFSRSSCS